jgi:hypothetical protein
MSDLLTVAEVATVLKMSEDTVLRRFEKVPGVIDLGVQETTKRRRYRVLRIPKVVVEKYLTGKSGHPVRIEVPDRPERRHKSVGWENRAILNLAKAGLQNECKDRKVYRCIADRARILTLVPESEWSEIVSGGWLDNDEE